jgi:hypothetical protein
MTYTVEAVRWSHNVQAFVRYRVTYDRSWLPDRQLWRDFLVRAEEVALRANLSAKVRQIPSSSN